jgi:hypothetical protein
MFASIITGSIQQGICLCLAVLVALGWGLVHDSVGVLAMRKVVILGALYTAVSALFQFGAPDVYAHNGNVIHSMLLYDLLPILRVVLLVMNVVFFVYAIVATNRTLSYLRNMDVDQYGHVQR